MKKIRSRFSIKIILSGLLIIGGSWHLRLPTTFISNTIVDVTPTSALADTTTAATVATTTGLPMTELAEWENHLFFKAINPGYTVDGTRDVGEFIELQNLSDSSLSLAGYSVRYINSSGKSTTLISFSEGSSMVGEFLLLRLARTANSAEAEAVYTTTIAMSSSSLELVHDDVVVDMVCWSSQANCATNFNSSKPTTLVRDHTTGIFSHLETYETHYDASAPTLILPEITDTPETGDETGASTRCQGLEFSEVYAYYATDQIEQFVELYNATEQTIDLSACYLRYKNKTYPLDGTLASDSYYAYYPATAGFSLTKNPSSSNTLEIVDSNGNATDALVYLHGQKKSTAYARFFDVDFTELWDLTYAPTPGAENVYQEFRSCPAGKVINPSTGNCINAASSTTTECPAGKYRNPLTGRCKNIDSESGTLKPCAEGYERNPETNRCRKVTAENDGAGYALVPTTRSSKNTFIALGVVLFLVSAGVIYIILQFRHEIARAARKVRQRLHHIRKNLVTRRTSLHRHK